MSGVSIAQGEWVLVCDGAKAWALGENVGDEKYPNLKVREVFEQDDLKTQRARAPTGPGTLDQFDRCQTQRHGADRLA